MDAALIGLLAGGATLLTPNRRLAAAACAAFDSDQLAAGQAAWRSPDVLPLGTWLGKQLQRALRNDEHLHALTPVQEQLAWQSVIAELAGRTPLADVPAAARLAREADQLAIAWRLELREGMPLSEDCAAFLRWRARYLRRCTEKGWLDAPRGQDLLIDRIAAGALRIEQPLIVYGFDQLTPQEEALFATVRAQGVPVTVRGLARGVGAATVAACEDQCDEWQRVAAAVRALLEHEPAARIGVVVPDLTASRDRIVRVFDDVLDPARVLDAAPRERVFNVSAGAPLAALPLVHAALALLRFATGAIAWNELSMLLRSPFLADADNERSQRAALDAHLRALGMLEIDLDRLVQVLRQVHPDARHACRALSNRLQAWRDRARVDVRGRRMPSAWSAVIAQLLAAIGWPGERTLDSEEYQTLRKWNELLAGLAHLDVLLGAIDFGTLCAHLARLAADTQFQPESRARPVQILGVLESAGLAFDHLFITGLHDEAWPQPARANPFLPIASQRAHGVPHASADWELGFARRTIEAWCGAARDVTFTHPTREGDRHLRPSPLLRAYPARALPAAAASHAHAMFAQARMEEIEDVRAPPLPEGHAVPAGAEMFRNQAACPFRAFVLHRLGARGLEEPVSGLDARRRGNLVHDVLERLWREWRTQAVLLGLSEQQCADAVAAACDAALDTLALERPDLVSAGFRTVERRRLQGLVGRLLELERMRAPFAVLESENRRDVAFGPVQMTTRIDRIDRLDDGRVVVLDYKTGRSSIGQWYGERPDAPQVPLYTLLQREPVAAASFVTLRPELVAFKGLGSEAGVLPDVGAPDPVKSGAADWGALLTDWRSVLDRLATQFLAGDARVDPKRFPKTCEHCALDGMCRVREAPGLAVVDEDSEEAGDDA